jgi:hypothetical protein
VNFDDEPYVKAYKRKTVTTKLIGWEGRAVLAALMLDVDRAGVLDLSGEQPVDAVAAVTEIPIDVCRVGLARLLERDVVRHIGDRLVLPRFLPAQDAKQSDRVRQAESRAKRAAIAQLPLELSVTLRDETVTVCDNESRSVTDSHEKSQHVTIGHSENRLDQIRSEDQIPPKPPRGGKRTNGLSKAPETIEPTEATLATASRTGRDWRSDWQACRDWAWGNGKLKADWQATLRNWMSQNAQKFGPSPGHSPRPVASAQKPTRPPQPSLAYRWDGTAWQFDPRLADDIAGRPRRASYEPSAEAVALASQNANSGARTVQGIVRGLAAPSDD